MQCGKLKLDLGCGENKYNNYIGIDILDFKHNIVRDVRRGLPFCDNSCVEIKAIYFLEHIQLNEDFIFVMNECFRVLKDKGKMIINVPKAGSNNSFADPTHCRFFTLDTFKCFEPKVKGDNAYSFEYGFIRKWKIDVIKDRIDWLYVELIANKI